MDEFSSFWSAPARSWAEAVLPDLQRLPYSGGKGRHGAVRGVNTAVRRGYAHLPHSNFEDFSNMDGESFLPRWFFCPDDFYTPGAKKSHVYRQPALRARGPPLRASGPPLRARGPPLRANGPLLRATMGVPAVPPPPCVRKFGPRECYVCGGYERGDF